MGEQPLEKMGKIEKEMLLKDLNGLRKNLLDYKKRQERHAQTKFTEGQEKSLNVLRLRIKDKYILLKQSISKYGGDVSIRIVGMTWDAFNYSFRSLYMKPDQFTALDKAINAVTVAIERIESIPVAIGDWRDISITPRPKDHPESPTYLFDSMQFHPKVIEASRELFKDGHYRDAIFRAFIEVNNFVKLKTGLELDGKALMTQVFRKENPIIKLNRLKTQSEKDEQEGFMFLFMGSMVGIRNPKAHDNIVQKDPYRTLEYLGFASLLIRRVEEGQLNSLSWLRDLSKDIPTLD